MGELVWMNQRRRGVALPPTFGILGSSKGNTFAVGSGGGGAAPTVAPISPGQLSTLVSTLSAGTAALPPQKISATGDTLPTSVDKARTMPTWMRRSAPPPLPGPVYVPIPYILPGETPPPPPPIPSVAPTPAGGGGGGGGALAGDDQGAADAGDAPVFLGLTKTQLAIGGGVALLAILLFRKKKPGTAAVI